MSKSSKNMSKEVSKISKQIRKQSKANKSIAALELALHGHKPSKGHKKGAGRARGPVGSSVFKTSLNNRTECISGLTTPGDAFTATSFILNPGNNTTFPWLSRIAANYEEYQFKKIEFFFDSTSGTSVASTNTALGSVLQNTNYDVLDSAFSNQTQMENYGGCCEIRTDGTTVRRPPGSSVVASATHRVSPGQFRGANRGYRYILNSTGSTASYPTSSSAHDYDVGRYTIATVGQQAACTIGRLYVTYSVDLLKPKTETPLGQSLLAAVYTSSTGLDATHQMGTSQTQVAGSNLTVSFGASLNFTLPAIGRYLCCYRAVGTTLAGSTDFAASTGSTSIRNGSNGANAGATSFTAWGVFDITAINGIVLLPTFTLATFTSGVLEVSQIPSGLTISLADRETMLEERLNRLETMLRRQNIVEQFDSDFEECKEDLSHPLSQSVLGQIGELISRKSNSTKK